MPAILSALSWEAMTTIAVTTLTRKCLGKDKIIYSEEQRWGKETPS